MKAIKDRLEKMYKFKPIQKKIRRHFMFKKWLLRDNQMWYYGLCNHYITKK